MLYLILLILQVETNRNCGIFKFIENGRKEIAKRKEEFLKSCESTQSELSSNTKKFTLVKNLIVKEKVIGSTHEGRNVSVVELYLDDDTKKPAIFIECTAHAREWISPQVCLYSIRELIDNSDKLLTHYNFHIVPITNPDGYVYSWTTDRMWSKNRNPDGPPPRLVDLGCSTERAKQKSRILGI